MTDNPPKSADSKNAKTQLVFNCSEYSSISVLVQLWANKTVVGANCTWYDLYMTAKKQEPQPDPSPLARLSQNIRAARTASGLTLDQLAHESEISKTYLWELENDSSGQKRPSAEILLKISNVLKTTIADLMGLPSVQVNKAKVEVSPSLIEFRDLMVSMGTPLSDEDMQSLAATRFRGGQPTSKDGWYDLYSALKRATGRK
jgi:transcriptional regulator with XRE-family HTH domain